MNGHIIGSKPIYVSWAMNKENPKDQIAQQSFWRSVSGFPKVNDWYFVSKIVLTSEKYSGEREKRFKFEGQKAKNLFVEWRVRSQNNSWNRIIFLNLFLEVFHTLEQFELDKKWLGFSNLQENLKNMFSFFSVFATKSIWNFIKNQTGFRFRKVQKTQKFVRTRF